MFEENIKHYAQELRDLKTAHTRGLGMMNFSTASATSPSISTDHYSYDIVVTFTEPETFPPTTQLTADQTKGGFFGATWDNVNLTFTTTYSGADYNDPAPTVKAVATAPISSITVTPL